jgi:hypothetical protein
MPFTFAHPAVVLPLGRLSGQRLSLSGLVIGSMIPDFEGFLLVTDVKTYSHTWHGMFWLDLPLCLAIAFLFHSVVRDALIDNLPAFFKKRFIGYRKLDWNQYFRRRYHWVLLSMCIGIFSHLLWDDFTHPDGFFVRHISFLQQWYYLAGKPYPVYKILQFGTSILGMAVVLGGIALMPKQRRVNADVNSVYWIITFCVALAFVAFRFILGLEITNASLLFITLISGGLLGLTVASALTGEISGSILKE